MRPAPRALGILALSVAAVMFGVTFLVVQDAVDRVEVAPFLAVRFLIGATVLAPLAFRRPATPGVARDGILAGSCLLGAYALQTIGLQDTSAASSAFITYLLVIVVPVAVALRTRRAPSRPVVIGVALAVAGLWALSGGATGLGRGELLTLGCAVLFGVHIIVLGEVSTRHDPFRLTFWQIITVSVACFVPPLVSGGTGSAFSFDGGVWWAAVFCGVGATAVAYWCMSWAQRIVSETQAALILLLEPVSAGILGELVGEHLGWRGGLGAILILAAVLVTELLDRTEPAAVGAEMAVIVEPEASAREAEGEPPEPTPLS